MKMCRWQSLLLLFTGSAQMVYSSLRTLSGYCFRLRSAVMQIASPFRRAATSMPLKLHLPGTV